MPEYEWDTPDNMERDLNRTDHGYECKKCGHVPTQRELNYGSCSQCPKPEKTMDIAGIDKAVLLYYFYNNAGASGGMAALARVSMKPATLDDLKALIAEMTEKKQELFFDYLLGRPLKIDITGDTLSERSIALFDRDAGEGKAAYVVEQARKAMVSSGPKT